MDPRDFFAPGWGDIVCEVPDGKVGELAISYTVIGEVTDRGGFEYGNTVISMDEALDGLDRDPGGCVPYKDQAKADAPVRRRPCRRAYHMDAVYICDHKVGQPHGIYPCVPGHQLRVRQREGL